jgi:hypothetical protein
MSQSARSVYAGYRFPPEIISHAVWLYFRFPLSLRMVEEMLAARGIVVSHETVRQWALKFGQTFANEIRRRLPRVGDKWHLDEVVIKVAGKTHWARRGPARRRAGCSAFASSHHPARVLRPIVGSQSAVMPGAKAEISERCDVRTELVGDDHRRHEAVPLQQFPHQLQRRALVASALHQKIENLALVVDRAPEAHLLAIDPDHHLLEMPT